MPDLTPDQLASEGQEERDLIRLVRDLHNKVVRELHALGMDADVHYPHVVKPALRAGPGMAEVAYRTKGEVIFWRCGKNEAGVHLRHEPRIHAWCIKRLL